VRQETSLIDVHYETKYMHAQMAQQIAASNLANKSRLRILNARQQVLDGIFDQARKKLPDVQNNKEKYQALLKDLILEVPPWKVQRDIHGARDFMRSWTKKSSYKLERRILRW
jgi:vacuolar-type H+-ATPase subunit E/Vma4